MVESSGGTCQSVCLSVCDALYSKTHQIFEFGSKWLLWPIVGCAFIKNNISFILRTNFLNMESTFRNKYYSKNNLAQKLAQNSGQKNPSTIVGMRTMEHLVVRFTQGLPFSIRRLGENGSFTIPKTKRLRFLQFMKEHPQHILKKRKSSWEVLSLSYPT